MDPERLADRLIECEQELASLPESEARLEQALADNAALEEALAVTRVALHDIMTSTSWRLTEPLRRLQLLARQR